MRFKFLCATRTTSTIKSTEYSIAERRVARPEREPAHLRSKGVNRGETKLE